MQFVLASIKQILKKEQLAAVVPFVFMLESGLDTNGSQLATD